MKRGGRIICQVKQKRGFSNKYSCITKQHLIFTENISLLSRQRAWNRVQAGGRRSRGKFAYGFWDNTERERGGRRMILYDEGCGGAEKLEWEISRKSSVQERDARWTRRCCCLLLFLCVEVKFFHVLFCLCSSSLLFVCEKDSSRLSSVSVEIFGNEKKKSSSSRKANSRMKSRNFFE